MTDRAKLIIRDPKDAVILASAIDAKLDYFVSGDLDFHTNEETFGEEALGDKSTIFEA